MLSSHEPKERLGRAEAVAAHRLHVETAGVLWILEARAAPDRVVFRGASVERVVENQMTHPLWMECRVVARPVASSRPPEERDPLDPASYANPVDHRRHIAHDLRRAHQRWRIPGRTRHLRWPRRLPVAAGVHHVDRVSRLREVGGERAAGHGQIERSDARHAGAVQQQDWRPARIRRLRIDDLAHVDPDARVALDEVVAARDHGMRRMGKPRDRQQDREDALPGHADEVRREAAGETISGRDWKRPRLPDRAHPAPRVVRFPGSRVDVRSASRLAMRRVHRLRLR